MSFLLSPMRRVPATTYTRAFSTSRPSQLARMTIVGRIGTDPEFSETSNGAQMMKYALASDGQQPNTTSWFNITQFSTPVDGRQAQYMKSLSKGTLVYLEGDATMRTYEDQEGKKRSALSIVQTKINVLKRPNTERADVDGAGSEEGALGV